MSVGDLPLDQDDTDWNAVDRELFGEAGGAEAMETYGELQARLKRTEECWRGAERDWDEARVQRDELRSRVQSLESERERLRNIIVSLEAKADGHYEGMHKAGRDDWLWVRAMCRDALGVLGA